MTASRTTPTLWVLVIMTGPTSRPDSSTQVVPVISPLPLSDHHPAMTASSKFLPRGRIAVTPVRTGPLPTTNFPSPEISVVWPTKTPETSVMAFKGPGVPSKGTPRSRARGFFAESCCPNRTFGIINKEDRTKRKGRWRIPIVSPRKIWKHKRYERNECNATAGRNDYTCRFVTGAITVTVERVCYADASISLGSFHADFEEQAKLRGGLAISFWRNRRARTGKAGCEDRSGF